MLSCVVGCDDEKHDHEPEHEYDQGDGDEDEDRKCTVPLRNC